jgi:RNA polymerase sigma factor (TIGR02999 family)
MSEKENGRPPEGLPSPAPARGEVTRVLDRIRRGDASAPSRLWELVYDELRRLAHRRLHQDPASAILQTTAVVHEAFLRLFDQSHSGWEDRAHFYRTAARAIRRILVDWSRRENASKRGGRRRRVILEESMRMCGPVDIELLDIDKALQKFRSEDARAAEGVELRIFGGLTADEVASVQGVSRRTAVGDWEYARTWLARALGEG